MSVIAGHHVPRSNDQRQYDTPSVPINIAPDSEGHIHEMSRLKDYEVIEKLGQGTFELFKSKIQERWSVSCN